MVKKLILEICSKVKRHAIALVDTFYPGEELFDSMIAPGNGDLYSSIINRLFYSGKTFERAKNYGFCVDCPPRTNTKP